MEASTSYLPPLLSPINSNRLSSPNNLNQQLNQRVNTSSLPPSSQNQDLNSSQVQKRSTGSSISSVGCRLLWRGKIVVDSEKGKTRALYG